MNKKKIALFTAVVIILSLILFPLLTASEAKYLVIDQQSVELTPGESLQLTVQSYDANDELLSAEQTAKLQVVWQGKCDDRAFSVNEQGLLTAHRAGVGNVWVKSADGKLNSRAITVYVR